MDEVPVSVEEAMEADEIFTTGTAVVLSPVGSLTYKGKKKQYGTPGEPSKAGGAGGGSGAGCHGRRALCACACPYPDPALTPQAPWLWSSTTR